MELLPPHLLEEAYRTHGQSLEALAAAYEIFCGEILQALQGLVPAVKVQSYCFDALGSCGIAAMQRLLRQAQRLGFYVMMDANYSSVGHIPQLYAAAVFGGLRTPDGACLQPYACDGLSVNPDLGSDSVRGVFALLQAAGEESVPLRQDLEQISFPGRCRTSSPVAEWSTARWQISAMRWRIDLFGKNGYSELIAAVGAPYPQVLRALRRQHHDRLFFLGAGLRCPGRDGEACR